MNQNYLQKISGFVKRYYEIPATPDYYNEDLTRDTSDEAQEKRAEAFAIIYELKRDIKAFIMVKLYERDEYLEEIDSIDFGLPHQPKDNKMPLTPKQIRQNEQHWNSQKTSLRLLLDAMEAEITEELDDYLDHYERLKLSEKIKLRRLSTYFFILAYLLLLDANFRFVYHVVDWQNAKVENPLTWVDKDVFSNGELVIGLWLTFNGVLVANFLKWLKLFRKWFYKRFRVEP